MVSHLTDASFNKIFSVVQAENFRQSNPQNPQSTATPIAKIIQAIPKKESDRKSRREKKKTLKEA